MTRRRRTIVAAIAAAVAVVAPSALLPATSQAAAYRYWSYWLGTDSGWSFANVGPSFRVPADGTLEGWRFSVSGIEGNHAPSFAADFDAVCAETAAVEGRKRVAVVVDPGVVADAPDGEQPPGAWAMCVVADARATGYDVLRAAATVRAERGLICGIGGYPARGCADVIAQPSPTPTKSPKPKPTRTPEPTRSPEPTRGAESSASSSAPAAPAQSTDPSVASPDASRAGAATPSPTPSAAATPTPAPTSSSAPPPATSPTPEPTYSLLTSPLEEPPADSGVGGALVAGIAVVGIAGLGAAAILRMRRSP